jgi:pilus assembly protein CpaC
MRRRWRAGLAFLAALALIAAPAAPAAAQPATPVATAGRFISVDVDRSYAIALQSPAKSVSVANPGIADVQVPGTREVIVIGRKPGYTTIHVACADGQVGAYTVIVQRPVRAVQEALRAVAPNAQLQVSGAPRGLTVTGQVETPREAAQAKAAASQFLDEKDNLNFGVEVTGDTQVNLQVRIVEVSRQVSRSLGFSWAALGNNGSTILGLVSGRQFLGGVGAIAPFTRDSAANTSDSMLFGYRSPGGSTNVNGVLDALQTEGMVSVLAQPNLTAASGQTASFLAGGEFPVPVSQENSNSLTIEWKKFGVALDFTPTVLDPGRLSIKVRPEVSEISDNGAVTINGIKVPALAVRRAETTVELASGQSFAIAGLFQNNITKSIREFPWLGDIPLFGQLLRSNSFTHDQSELVIIVTPYIVRPVNQAGALHTPADGLAFTNELEEIVMGRLTAAPDHPHLKGPAGFILEDTP